MADTSSPAPTLKPTSLDVMALQPSPAPQLGGNRRNSGTKVGSRAPNLTLATSGEGVPETPPMPKFTPKFSPLATAATPIAAADTADSTEKAAPAAAASPTPKVKVAATPTPRSRASSASGTPKAVPKATGINQVAIKSSLKAKPATSGTSTGTNTPRARSSSQQSSNGSVSRGLSPAQSPGAARPAAGAKTTARFIKPRASLRSVAGKSNTDTDVFGLFPPTESESKNMESASRVSKRTNSVAYASTGVVYSDAESRQFQSEQRLGGKRTTNTHSDEAPWEHNQYSPPSPKRAGSAKPPVLTAGHNAPWTKEPEGSLYRSCRSHSAVVRSVDAPFGVSLDQPTGAFQKGETKIVQHPRPAGGRPTTGRSCSKVPRDHDVLNPDAVPEKSVPSGRRPPPSSALEPTQEATYHSTKRQVYIPERVEKSHGKRTNSAATALSPSSPFRDRGGASFAEATSPRSTKVMVKGFSGGAQSMHIDPNNMSSITSLHTPHRQRVQPTNRGRSNIESTPGSDLHSKLSVDPVRFNRNKSTLVGVLSPAPAIRIAPYEVTPPFWTVDANN